MDKESLQASISHFDQCEKYRVDEILRHGDIEDTEVVYQVAADGSQSGPFIRKHFSDPELWDLYKRIHDAQINGLRVPSLPRVYEVGKDASGYYSILEFVKGANLREAHDFDSFTVFEDACNAVRVLHESFVPPIIHRDVKPDNVIAVPDGVVLIDFGAARIYDESKDHDTHPYATRAYAPPEQFGYAQTDVRSDIYSLGMLLVFLETGEDPDFDTKQAIRLGEAALIERGVSIPAAKTIVRACAFDPKLRFSSIDSMLDFLHEEIKTNGTEIEDWKRRANPDLQNESFDASEHAHDLSYLSEPTRSTSNLSESMHDLSSSSESLRGPSYSPPMADSLINVGTSDRSFGSNNAGRNFKRSKNISEVVAQWHDAWKAGAFFKVGIVWDIVLLVVWAFFLIVAISLCFSSDADLVHLPMWFKLVEYLGLAMTFFTICLAILLDWRPIRSVKRLAWLKRRFIIVPMVAIFAICLFVVMISAM